MNPTDLLTRLEAEGVGVTLNLKVSADAKPSDDTRALIREHRDTLLEHLIAQAKRTRVSDPEQPSIVPTAGHLEANYARVRNLEQPSNDARVHHLHLYGDLLHHLMVWIHRYHELRLEHPGGIILNAKPEHAAHHLTASAWAVLYDETKTILATSGNVPECVLKGKTELQPVQSSSATAEKVLN